MSILSNGFDYFGFHEIPTFVLCNPNKTPLHALSGITDRQLEWNLNAMSTLTFKAYPVVDDQIMEYYDLLKSKRLVLVDELAYFIITSVKECDDGITKYKEITANTLEAELVFKKVNLVSGTYKFYDVFSPQTSLLGRVLSNCPGWTVGTVDSDLINKYRYFEVTDTTVYNFLMTTVEEAVECVFVFDTFAKTISAYSATNIIKPTNIYLSHDNLMLETEVTELTDELFTAVQVSGGNDLTIYTVNPLGNNYEYNFSYYKKPEWMSQSLIDAITAWEDKVASQTTIHQTLILNYYNYQASLYGVADDVTDTGLYGDLDTLNQELSVLEIEQSSKIAKGESLTDVNSRIASKKAEIVAKQAQIQDVLDEVSLIISQLNDINEALSFETNFTAEQLLALSPFIIETSYQNENFIQLDTMKPTQIQDQAQQLYDQAKKVLARIAQPRYEFSIDSLNILFMQEFAQFRSQLELGCEIYAELAEGVIHKPVLLQISLNYDDASEFSMTFGNRLRLDSSEFVFADLFGKAVATSSQVSLNSVKWNNFENEYKDEVVDFMNSSLDASKNAVVTSANQDFKMDAVGIRGKTTVNGVTSPEQIWINNSTLAFTDDNWNTASLALGKITLEGGTVGYGLVADAIIGKLIAGNQLLISNANSSFLVDANGVTVTDTNFTIKHTEGSTTTSQTFGEAMLTLNTRINQVEAEASTMTTFYQDTIPSNAKSGDLWYNTSVIDIISGSKTYKYGKLYRYNGTDSWDLIQDEGVTQAVALAQNAQDTADGKITTFYAPQKSESDISPNVTGYTFANGDLWINTTNGQNSMYRYNSTTQIWISVKDKDITTALTGVTNLQTKLGQAFKADGIIDASALDGIIDTAKAYMTAASSQVVFDSTGMWLMNNTSKNSATEAIWMNERGILLGKRATGGTDWLATDFKTAVTASGISADIITTGTLNAIAIKGGSIYIGGNGTADNCVFGVTDAGKVVGIDTTSGAFKVDKNGNITINGNLILGGTITWNTHDPNIATAQTTANSAVSTANSAISTANSAVSIANGASVDVEDLADGRFSGGSFINNKQIFAPDIYSNHFKIIPEGATSLNTQSGHTTGLSAYGLFGSSVGQQFFNVYAWDAGTNPQINLSTPWGGYIFFETTKVDFSYCDIVDFTGVTVNGLTAKFA